MKKNKKYILISFTVILVIIAGLIITSKILFSPERVRKTLEKRSSQILQREVKIRRARLGFAKIILDDIQIENKTSEMDLFSCKRVEIKFKLLPLLKKEIYLNELYVEEPVLNFDNKLNIDITRLMSNKFKSISSGGRTRFGINKFGIENANINFYPPDFPRLNLKDIDIKLEGESIKKPVLLNVKLDPGVKYVNDIVVDMSLDLVKNESYIKNLIIGGIFGKVKIEGEIDEFFTGPQLDLQYDIMEFPDEFKEKNLTIAGIPEFSGSIETFQKRIKIDTRIDMSSCKIDYKDIYSKKTSEKLKLQGGFSYDKGNIDIDWYLLKAGDINLSGTGNIINNGRVAVNILGEDIDLKKAGNNFPFINKYIWDGNMKMRGSIEGQKDDMSLGLKLELADLGLKNFKGLTELYKKLTDKTVRKFKIDKTFADLELTKQQLLLENLKMEGGDLSGYGKGYYKWNEDMNFILYPRIEGQKIGLRVYGSTDNVKVGLK